MKRNAFLWMAGSLVCAVLTAPATTRYVNLNNPAPARPYTSWPTAATNIQHAIDEAADGDEIVVTNGVYVTGGRAVYGTMTNRVVIDKAVTVRSVSGPLLTVIEGSATWWGGGEWGRGDTVRVCGDQRGAERVYLDQRSHPAVAWRPR